jgi:hypothetical protein
MTEITVGTRINGTIDIDFCDTDSGKAEWNYNNVSVEQAEFIIEELQNAITRARPRAEKLAAIEAAEKAKADAALESEKLAAAAKIEAEKSFPSL